MLGCRQRLADPVERRGLVRVATDVSQARQESAEGLVVRGAQFLDRGAGVRAQVGIGPFGAPGPDHRHFEQHVTFQPVERGERLVVREIARDPEDHQGVGWASVGHVARDPPGAVTATPTRGYGPTHDE